MAERSREKPSGEDATLYVPVTVPRPEPAAGPPSSERTQMFVQDPATQQPKGESTLMYVAPQPAPQPQPQPQPRAFSPQYPPSNPHSHPQASPSDRNRGPYGSSPEPVIPGSQPPPGYPMHMMQPGHDPRRMMPMPQTGGPFRPAPLGGPPTVVLQGAPDPRLVLITEPDSARAVSFRLLRDNLLAKRMPRVLAVSSAARNDGKTTCAMNLALSFAERAKVLLLDGNLLEPELASIFSIPESTPPWPMNAPWLHPYRIVQLSPGLHVAAIMPQPGQPAPRFEKQWFEQVMGALRRFPYDFIIIDAAAVSASPTVAQLIATADATLMAVRAGVTTARALRRATDQIPEGRGIGIALIDAAVRP